MTLSEKLHAFEDVFDLVVPGADEELEASLHLILDLAMEQAARAIGSAADRVVQSVRSVQ